MIYGFCYCSITMIQKNVEFSINQCEATYLHRSVQQLFIVGYRNPKDHMLQEELWSMTPKARAATFLASKVPVTNVVQRIDLATHEYFSSRYFLTRRIRSSKHTAFSSKVGEVLPTTATAVAITPCFTRNSTPLFTLLQLYSSALPSGTSIKVRRASIALSALPVVPS